VIEGEVKGAYRMKSGRKQVRLPSSLHAALEREAVDEGVSLNQLVVAKLAVQLKTASARKSSSRRWKSS
jgi:predicted HicB family RNase H-like nuclease